MTHRNTRVIASGLGTLSGPEVRKRGKIAAACGRCGRTIQKHWSAGVRFCRDCRSSDPSFCRK